MSFLKTRNNSKHKYYLRRGFLFAPLFMIVLFGSGYSASSPFLPLIQGQTVDTENRVVPYTSIIFKHSKITLLSNEYGYFSCMTPFESDDSLTIRRIGFREQVIPVADLTSYKTIQMEPNTIELAEIKVEATSSQIRSTVMPLLRDYSKSAVAAGAGHGQVLSRIPGVTVRTYGGSAGIMTLAVDGGPSSQTRVTLNGMSLTSPQNGETDVSQIPVSYLKRMLYLPADISQNSTGSGDGILKLESSPTGNHMSLSAGSYGKQSADLGLITHLGGVLANIQLGQRYDRGNYPVTWDGSRQVRQNNAFDQKYVGLSLLYPISSELFWRLQLLESHQFRGAAGLIWSPDTLSHREDQLRMVGTKLLWNRQSGHTTLNVNSRFSLEEYQNPGLSINSQHELFSLEGSIQDNSRLGQSTQLMTELNFREDRISSTDTEDHRFTTWSGGLTPHIDITNLRISPSLKLYYSPSRFKRMTGDIQTLLDLDFGPVKQVSLSFHEVFRYPSFNDLYWQPGGNQDLEPEETQVLTAQIRSQSDRAGIVTLQWQQKTSDNLIQWSPAGGIWIPQNLKSTWRQSTKLSWQKDAATIDLSLFANIAFIRTLDDQLDKPLRYAPEQTAALGLLWSPAKMEIELNYRYLGERVSMYDFPEDTWLPSVSTWFTAIGYTHPFKRGSATVTLNIENLTDLRYETIRGYPEPGRIITAGIQYNW